MSAPTRKHHLIPEPIICSYINNEPHALGPTKRLNISKYICIVLIFNNSAGEPQLTKPGGFRLGENVHFHYSNLTSGKILFKLDLAEVVSKWHEYDMETRWDNLHIVLIQLLSLKTIHLF